MPVSDLLAVGSALLFFNVNSNVYINKVIDDLDINVVGIIVIIIPAAVLAAAHRRSLLAAVAVAAVAVAAGATGVGCRDRS